MGRDQVEIGPKRMIVHHMSEWEGAMTKPVDHEISSRAIEQIAQMFGGRPRGGYA
jgi:hypothetical protein